MKRPYTSPEVVIAALTILTLPFSIGLATWLGDSHWPRWLCSALVTAVIVKCVVGTVALIACFVHLLSWQSEGYGRKGGDK